MYNINLNYNSKSTSVSEENCEIHESEWPPKTDEELVNFMNEISNIPSIEGGPTHRTIARKKGFILYEFLKKEETIFIF